MMGPQANRARNKTSKIVIFLPNRNSRIICLLLIENSDLELVIYVAIQCVMVVLFALYGVILTKMKVYELLKYVFSLTVPY